MDSISKTIRKEWVIFIKTPQSLRETDSPLGGLDFVARCQLRCWLALFWPIELCIYCNIRVRMHNSRERVSKGPAQFRHFCRRRLYHPNCAFRYPVC